MGREWLRDGVIYEVFPRNFSSSGALPGVTRRLDDLAFLGINVLWLMPIHPIGQLHRKGELGSPYSIVDHRAVDPAVGTLDDLRELVVRAHALGLRVIMDFVGNHGAWDGVVARDHRDWIVRDDDGRFLPAKPQWKDVVGFDLNNPALQRYLVETLLYWVREADVDGFRCDVAGLLPVSFWEAARAALDREKPDAGLLAEAYDPALMGVFDLCYDTPLYRALRRTIRQGDPVQGIWDARDRFLEEFPADAGRMIFLENHDQRRAASYFGPKAAEAAAVLLFTFEGTPLIHAGQEIGTRASTHRGGLFEERLIDWLEVEEDLWVLYQHLLGLRAIRPALVHGALRPLATGYPTVIAYTRTLTVEHQDEDALLVAVNLSPEPATARLLELPFDLRKGFLSWGGGHGVYKPMSSSITLDPWGWIITDRIR